MYTYNWEFVYVKLVLSYKHSFSVCMQVCADNTQRDRPEKAVTGTDWDAETPKGHDGKDMYFSLCTSGLLNFTTGLCV